MSAEFKHFPYYCSRRSMPSGLNNAYTSGSVIFACVSIDSSKTYAQILNAVACCFPLG